MNSLYKLIGTTIAAIALSTTGVAFAGDKQTASESKAEMRADNSRINDAWLKGKVEMALLLNRHLNSFKIDTDVESSVVTLKGKVKSDIDMDLAEQIALGVDGVSTVENELVSVPEEDHQAISEHEEERQFLQRMEDLTMTARIKSKLVMNQHIAARRVNVDTANNVVTLEGKVNNDQERDLIVQIAKNTGSVTEVKDKLEIAKQHANR